MIEAQVASLMSEPAASGVGAGDEDGGTAEGEAAEAVSEDEKARLLQQFNEKLEHLTSSIDKERDRQQVGDGPLLVPDGMTGGDGGAAGGPEGAESSRRCREAGA